MPLVQPLDPNHDTQTKELAEFFNETLGFCPNSVLTMQHRPAISKAFINLNKAVMANEGKVTSALKRMIAWVSSNATGCRYCQAHAIRAAERYGAEQEQLDNIWEYKTHPAFNEGGLFNEANLNNLGWIVDGAAEMSAGGNNTNNTYWKETNGPKKFNGRCYDTTDNTKFAIVSGVSIYDAPDHTIAPLSTLETPIFNTLGLTTATLEFDQAYYLEAGAWISVESINS